MRTVGQPRPFDGLDLTLTRPGRHAMETTVSFSRGDGVFSRMPHYAALILSTLLLFPSTSRAWGFYAHLDQALAVARDLELEPHDGYLFALGSVLCDLDKTDNLQQLLVGRGNRKEPVQPPHSFHSETSLALLLDLAQEHYPHLLPLVLGMSSHLLADRHVDRELPIRSAEGLPNDLYDEVIVDMDLLHGTRASEHLALLAVGAPFGEQELIVFLHEGHQLIHGDLGWNDEAFARQLEHFRGLLILYLTAGTVLREAISLDPARGQRDAAFYDLELELLLEGRDLLLEHVAEEAILYLPSGSAELFPDLALSYEQLDDASYDPDHPLCAARSNPRSSCMNLLPLLLIAALYVVRFRTRSSEHLS